MENTMSHPTHTTKLNHKVNLWATYKPLILVAAFIIGVTAMIEIKSGELVTSRSMNNFMAGFFIFFSFFKLLNLQAFADAYSTYDVIAKRSRAYAISYPFIELALGVCFTLEIFTTFANALTILFMLVGNYSVWLVLKRKGTIQCACLGTIFNLPMTKITLFENTVMLAMAAMSLTLH